MPKPRYRVPGGVATEREVEGTVIVPRGDPYTVAIKSHGGGWDSDGTHYESIHDIEEWVVLLRPEDFRIVDS